jgi:fused signal recognition particle receptor
MFGFLRRKKPVDPTAMPDAAGIEPPHGFGAERAGPAPPPVEDADLEAQALAAARTDTTPGGDGPISNPNPPRSEVSEPAPAARPGFWARFVPGGRTPAAVPSSAPSADTTPNASQPPTPPLEPAAARPGDATAATNADAPTPDAAAPAATSPDAVAKTGDALALVQAPMADRTPWLARLKKGLSRTSGNLAGLFIGVKVDEALFEELETALLTSDTGVETTQWLLSALRERVKKDRLTESQQVKAALRALLVELMLPLEQPVDIDRASPLVVMITGVNGAGKTTSIGKLARHLRHEGKSVLLAAADTFRAAAREQLAQWGSRNEVDVISQQGGDPAAVAFDAVAAGRARGTGVVLVDTAGRLPTQTHLMDELKKVRRVITKAMDGAPHEVLLVLDGNTGQNMLAQVRAFDESVQLTGLIVTKLDGTAKGGALAALAHTRRARPIPVYFIGVGEGIDDLQAFSAEEFAGALVD